MAAEVRPERDDEAGRVGDLLSRAAFGPTVSRLISFPRESPSGDVLVADDRGAMIGAVCSIAFGVTGWIGALGVTPAARRRGIGRALTVEAIDRLHARGVTTILLFATDMGRPLYEHLGFAADGEATAWRGIAGARGHGIHVRRLHEGDRSAVAELDRAATGEDRAVVLDAMHPLAGLGADHGDGRLAGWAARGQHGAGIGICADSEAAGVALLAAAGGGTETATLVVPEANAGASAALRRWGFRPSSAGLRMRLGPPVAWRPELQFGLFNLFWG